MSELITRLQHALAGDGPLARAWPGWHAREPQRRMALAVAATLEEGGVLLAQQATGSGKTIAYLLPVLLSGVRAIVATSTHVLQHQLAAGEIPRLAQALGLPVRAAVLKGRGRYVCLHRVQEAVQRGPRPGALAQHARLRELLEWAQRSREGDLDELPAVADDPALRAVVVSTSESCLRQACPRWSDCHVERARRRAGEADVVVINHALWLGELRAKRQGRSAGVPGASAVVFDEAHALRDQVQQWHTTRAEAPALARFWRDVEELAQGPARGAAPWAALALQGRRALRSLALALQTDLAREGLQPWPPMNAALARDLGFALQGVHQALRAAQGSDVRVAALGERAVRFASVLQGVLAPAGDDSAWLDWRDAAHWALVRPGADAGPAAAHELATGAAWGARSVVHTSATLGDEPGLRWHRDALGLHAAAPVRVLAAEEAAPWPGAAWHVPRGLPEPAEPGHGEALARCIAAWAPQLDGHALVLTTTRRAAQRMALVLAQTMPTQWRVLHASEEGHRRAWAALRSEDPRRSPTVVVASGAFWRGLDVPDNALRLVVVDKLPFAPPDDPWLQRRLEHARAQGQDPFASVQLVDAAMALRQAAGRLIRGPQGRGLFVVGDVRLRSRAYGPRLAAALAQWRWLEDEVAVNEWLSAQALTTASTTGRSCA
ncbi:ATP-dependent DNA helicase [Hydrogenophaga intermedia]|uniref:ATP-dependent DNA helicase n=1 Tax=Hydrogenophaga intermedia TaxID=65786 RepID=UPI00204414B0|nr:ATP-dependent DNA helicase [Hydrogenophaga intermedia]MCM3564155.1 ATP-dependent DNA helicase [Hydrogenophaga intermedia]